MPKLKSYSRLATHSPWCAPRTLDEYRLCDPSVEHNSAVSSLHSQSKSTSFLIVLTLKKLPHGLGAIHNSWRRPDNLSGLRAIPRFHSISLTSNTLTHIDPWPPPFGIWHEKLERSKRLVVDRLAEHRATMFLFWINGRCWGTRPAP